MQKIIHIDMDAFYASVEMRDNPKLKGPVAVAWSGPRSVVLTANYEARRYGVHSALASRLAKEKCPHLTFVPPQMELYRQVSKEIRKVFERYTDVIEPLSLDEAYLDVTTAKQEPASATILARRIKRDIVQASRLTASAGVSYNKFLAKLASGMNKPDGLTVIKPDDAEAIILALAVEKFHGIGPATSKRLHERAIFTGADLKKQSLEDLKAWFGKVGAHFYAIARGIDERPVEANRPYKSLSTETTFETDLENIERLIVELKPLAEQLEARLNKAGLQGRAVVVKLKYQDFSLITRRQSLPQPISTQEELVPEAAALLRKLKLKMPVRLLGLGLETLSSVDELVQPSLFS